MENDPLRGPKLKIKRANDYINEMHQLLIETFNGSAYQLIIERDPFSEDRLAKIKFIGEIPETLFTKIPETTYHLRSALDQLTVALARANGLTNTSRIYFPFAGNLSEFLSEKTQRKIKGVHPDAAEIIKSFKPYRGGDDFLWGLSKLSNLDKHIDLIPIGTIGGVNTFNDLEISNAKIGIVIGGHNRLDDGIVISNLGTNGTIRPKRSNSRPNFEVSGTIAFGNVDIFEGKPVLAVLLHLKKFVEEIINTLEPHC